MISFLFSSPLCSALYFALRLRRANYRTKQVPVWSVCCAPCRLHNPRSGVTDPSLIPSSLCGSHPSVSRCLQACQIAGFATPCRESCGVCLQRYAEPLKIPPAPVLEPGDLLLASPSMTGTFKDAVILMCEFDNRILGVVISHECPRPPAFPPLPKARFFVGGPVCGGRFGVVQYLMCVA